jgi:restriction endonuclease S subunit
MNKSYPAKKLTDLCKLERGTEPGSDSYIKDLVGTIPFLRVGDLTGKVDAKRFVKKSNNNLQVVSKNETLITFDGTPGIVVRGFSGAIASGIRVIRNLKPEINGDFLFYYLQTPVVQKTIRAYSKGATIIHASAAIPHIKILLPPLKIQQKIVERLDAIKKAQELNDKQIELAEELFQSLLHRELDPKGKNWEVKKLGDVCEIARGGSPRPINKYLTKSPDGINWIKIGDVKEGEKYITSTAEKIKPEGISKTRLVQEGDLILSNSMSFGRPYILKISGAIHDGWLLLHINNANEILQDFLYYILGTSQIKIQFEKFASGGVVKNLNSDLVRKVKILLPPLETQQKIVEKLSTVQEYKKKLLDQKQKLQELFESVLNKSFKGKSPE